jgi:phosphotransferase system enzyme I (PtsP)
MAASASVESRVLLKRLRETLALTGSGQERLDRITRLIAGSLVAEVCSIYLKRDSETLELCATEGLKAQSVHQARLPIGQGLVGRIAETATPINVADAPATPGFRYMPETGEEIYSSFLGVPIQRLGEVLGVLVIQNRARRTYTEDEVDGLEIVAMVLAEMAELGAFTGPGSLALAAPHKRPFFVRGMVAQEGVAEGQVVMHEPAIIIANPVADDPATEKARLHDALQALRSEVDAMIDSEFLAPSGEHRDVLHAMRMFAQDKGWVARMEEAIDSGLAAEVAVEKEQSATRSRMQRVADPYLRERLHDLDDLSNRLLRLVAGGPVQKTRELPPNPVLVARNLGPGELLDYGRALKGVVLEEGSVGSHATVVARALNIPLVIQAARITREALNGDRILVDGDQGVAHLRPEEGVVRAFREKIAMQDAAQQAYAALREEPARTRDGTEVDLFMNAGLMADLPSLAKSGAKGVGLYRTELQFLVRSTVPRRSEQADLYARVMDSARGLPVTFRTLDIGSDKVVAYLSAAEEPNPAMGWRAVRLTLDRRGVMRMQIQALLRGAKGRPLRVMFPMVTDVAEFRAARDLVMETLAAEKDHRHLLPESLKIGAMLETPSLVYAPDAFFDEVDFISIGGNDLKQFFFAADRENEKVRLRYDTLSPPFLALIRQIVARCATSETPLSFCGEDAGRPVDAVALTACGLRELSMRPASIGPVKQAIRAADLSEVTALIAASAAAGEASARPRLRDYLKARSAI